MAVPTYPLVVDSGTSLTVIHVVCRLNEMIRKHGFSHPYIESKVKNVLFSDFTTCNVNVGVVYYKFFGNTCRSRTLKICEVMQGVLIHMSVVRLRTTTFAMEKNRKFKNSSL
jgi:hypothetical protein